jgi:hypothetical protein
MKSFVSFQLKDPISVDHAECKSVLSASEPHVHNQPHNTAHLNLKFKQLATDSAASTMLIIASHKMSNA